MNGKIYNQQIIKEEIKGEDDDKSQFEESIPKLKAESKAKLTNDEREIQNNVLKGKYDENFNQNEITKKTDKSGVNLNNQESNTDGVVIDDEDNLPNFDEGNRSADSD